MGEGGREVWEGGGTYLFRGDTARMGTWASNRDSLFGWGWGKGGGVLRFTGK